MISVRRLSMRLPSGGAVVDVLADISLEVPAGTVPRGGGSIGQRQVHAARPRRGTRPTDGRPDHRRRRRRHAARRRRAGPLPPRHDRVRVPVLHLIPTLTALENVAVPLELAGEREARSARRALLGRRRTRRPRAPLSRPALRRRAAARRRRARRLPSAAPAPGRRADRQPGLGHGQADHRAAGLAQPHARQHARARHPRRRAGHARRPGRHAPRRAHRERRAGDNSDARRHDPEDRRIPSAAR